jgi:hypothetical protein
MNSSMKAKIAAITAAAEAKGIVAGGRVRLTGTERTGTVKRVEYNDIRVIWDEGSRQHPSISATWTGLHRLEPVT